MPRNGEKVATEDRTFTTKNVNHKTYFPVLPTVTPSHKWLNFGEFKTVSI